MTFELYPEVKTKVLEWGEDITYLPNHRCPFCGRYFKLGDEVVIVEGQPIFKITGDPELDKVNLATHLKCLTKAFLTLPPRKIWTKRWE